MFYLEPSLIAYNLVCLLECVYMLFTSACKYTLSDVHKLSVRVIKAQSLGFCLRLRGLVRYGIQQQLRFPAANMTFTRDDNTQYIQ